MQIDNVNAKKGDLTIAVTGLADTAKQIEELEKNQNVRNRHTQTQRCGFNILPICAVVRGRALNGGIVKVLINNQTQKTSVRQMPHMNALCDRAMLLRWFEKKTLTER